MISALLLPLLFTGAPAQPAVASHDDPPIQLWISNDRRFSIGDRAKVQVRTEYDGYLIVFHVDPEGHLRVLFPLDPDKDGFVRGDKKYEIRGRGGREAFDVDGSRGRGTVYAAVSHDPFHFDGFILGDHWDYRALAPARLPSDPESEVNQLVHRMAQGSFDYDLLNYEVFDRASYASDYSSRYYGYGSSYGDPWCSFSCGSPYFGHSSFSIGLFFGRPYRPFFYDPYYYAYDPYYSPFFHDPYYYSPVYYPRYGYPRRYYGYDQYYYSRYGGYNRPYTPYRFRGADGFNAGYRDRRQDLRRSVNTVYNPPISPVWEPAEVSPARRVTRSSGTELPEGVSPRRSVGQEQRLDNKPIDARRAREPETTRPARSSGSSNAEPVRREVEARRNREAPEPRVERAREQPRQVERAPARESPPARREVERPSSPPPQDRGGRQAQGGSGGGGGSLSDRGSRPSHSGGRRR